MNIILTSSKKLIIDDEHRFVTIGPNCWGASEISPEAAHKNARSNCSRRYRGRYVTRVVHKSFQVDSVDGSLTWDCVHEASTCPLCTVGKGIYLQVRPTSKVRQ